MFRLCIGKMWNMKKFKQNHVQLLITSTHTNFTVGVEMFRELDSC